MNRAHETPIPPPEPPAEPAAVHDPPAVDRLGRLAEPAEPDPVARTAAVLRRALLGREITAFEARTPALQAALEERGDPVGMVVRAVEARARHLLLVLAPADAAALEPGPLGLPLCPGALVLHAHLQLLGAWHAYAVGEHWRKPARRATAVLHVEGVAAPCFSAPVLEALRPEELPAHPALAALMALAEEAPEALTTGFDPVDLRLRLRRRPEMQIGVALLSQRGLAGLGNVLKSELLFIRRVSPFRKVSELSDEVLERLISEGYRLMREQRASHGGARRSIPAAKEREHLFVYGRDGEPCRVCGASLRVRRHGLDARPSYFCPSCQHVA